MLSCVYHPIEQHRVVSQEEAERLINTGVWFDCPKKAREYKEQVEQEIKAEKKPAKKAKEVLVEPEVKTEEIQNEREEPCTIE